MDEDIHPPPLSRLKRIGVLGAGAIGAAAIVSSIAYQNHTAWVGLRDDYQTLSSQVESLKGEESELEQQLRDAREQHEQDQAEIWQYQDLFGDRAPVAQVCKTRYDLNGPVTSYEPKDIAMPGFIYASRPTVSARISLFNQEHSPVRVYSVYSSIGTFRGLCFTGLGQESLATVETARALVQMTPNVY